MTASDWRKILKQLRNKPEKRDKFLKHNKPQERTTGIARKKCERCGRFGAHIKSYGLNFCRHCFREIAVEIGFKKYS
ncbi:MAG: 30S ribosomal protein S14 [Nanoarchaeota archaeon]|nr:30S ribosomal protein S14 [Nanoarchaeota archaeon]MBU1501154.1 30S ribosomal protein S14 [Nanoarchaeota archaeon]MBU2458834.1 30S ribosomal protein S14 [Nanoarchaeota archaeon]